MSVVSPWRCCMRVATESQRLSVLPSVLGTVYTMGTGRCHRSGLRSLYASMEIGLVILHAQGSWDVQKKRQWRRQNSVVRRPCTSCVLCQPSLLSILHTICGGGRRMDQGWQRAQSDMASERMTPHMKASEDWWPEPFRGKTQLPGNENFIPLRLQTWPCQVCPWASMRNWLPIYHENLGSVWLPTKQSSLLGFVWLTCTNEILSRE